jgi:hypothetical protein
LYFPDLTLYEYGEAEPRAGILNVGWLSAEHPFPIGVSDGRFVQVLERLVASPVNLYRGSHLCEFCPCPPTILSRGGIPMLDPPPGTTGNGEIRVIDGEGVYVAPTLILHYVVVHQYRPPEAFVDAVIKQAILG